MRVFISGLSDYFGATLAGALAASPHHPIVGGTIDPSAPLPTNVAKVLVRTEGGITEEDLATQLSAADVVVMDLHGPLSEAVAIVKALRRRELRGGTTRMVVCVSSVQTWGRTPAGRRRG